MRCDGILALKVPCPDHVPLEMVDDRACHQNHDDSAKNLSRHGLTPVELYYVMRGEMSPSCEEDLVSVDEAIRYIQERLSGVQ